MKIIVVDDNSFEMQGICKIIRSLPIEADIAATFENGEAAFAYLRENPVDIVVSDIQMPFMNGLELLEEMRKNKIKSKLILVSCYDDFAYAKSAIDLGAGGYVLKPVIREELEQVLRKVSESIKKESSILSDRKQLLEQIKKLRPIKREQFLRNLIFHYVSESDDILESASLLELNILTGPKAVACIRLDGRPAQNEMLAMSGVIHYINTLEYDGFFFYPVVISNNTVAVVCALPRAGAGLLEEIVITIKNSINESLGISVSMGISSYSEAVDSLHILYKQAIDALGYTTSGRANKIVFSSDVSAIDLEEIDIRVIQGEVNEIILQGKLEGCDRFIEKHLKKNRLYSNTYLNNFAHCVVYSIQMALLEYRKSMETEVGTELWAKLSRFESIVNFEQWISNLLYFAVRLVNEPKEDATEKIVSGIKGIVAARYHAHLTVTDIASELFFSSKYLSNTFKRATGQSIFEYLTEYRMERAKELLREKDSKIYVVSEQVGYKRKTHFSDVFKQYTGVSPSEYKSKTEGV